ncbi:MAG: Uma2 family endonuclease [Akkermansiaceae bacterium]|nr:Uma2 family endonuclease [Armatimonadota bacterium]
MSLTLTLDETITGGTVRLWVPNLTDEMFWRFAKQNEGAKTETTAQGELLFYMPTGGGSGASNTGLTVELGLWARRDGTGTAFDSSTLFVLPNGAKRSPDAAWVTNARWNALSDAEKEKPVPFAPDFAAEILSPTDSLTETKAKMEEYKANGVRLGWLIDRLKRTVYIYRPGTADPEILDDPATVSGDPELPGFSLDMSLIFLPRRTP